MTVKTATEKKRQNSTSRKDKAPTWLLATWLIHAPKDDGAEGSLKIPACRYYTIYNFVRKFSLDLHITIKWHLPLQTYLQEWRHQLSASLELQEEEKEKIPTCFSAKSVENKDNPHISITD